MGRPVFVELDLPKPWLKFRLPPVQLTADFASFLIARTAKVSYRRATREAEALVELVDILTLMKARTKQKNP